MEKISIIDEELSIPRIDENGNVDRHSNSHYSFLEKDGKRISNSYLYIEGVEIPDHYIVAGFTSTQPNIDQDWEYYEGVDKKQLALKYGIICLTRDEHGWILPMQEELVVPYLYDNITNSNLEAVTAYVGEKLTYVDLAKKSPSYGVQLVPAVLDHAVPFCVPYEGFAECSINGIVGYISRAMKPRLSIEGKDLLSEDDVKHLHYGEALDKYIELSGGAKVKKIIK